MFWVIVVWVIIIMLAVWVGSFILYAGVALISLVVGAIYKLASLIINKVKGDK